MLSMKKSLLYFSSLIYFLSRISRCLPWLSWPASSTSLSRSSKQVLNFHLLFWMNFVMLRDMLRHRRCYWTWSLWQICLYTLIFHHQCNQFIMNITPEIFLTIVIAICMNIVSEHLSWYDYTRYFDIWSFMISFFFFWICMIVLSTFYSQFQIVASD